MDKVSKEKLIVLAIIASITMLFFAIGILVTNSLVKRNAINGLTKNYAIYLPTDAILLNYSTRGGVFAEKQPKLIIYKLTNPSAEFTSQFEINGTDYNKDFLVDILNNHKVPAKFYPNLDSGFLFKEFPHKVSAQYRAYGYFFQNSLTFMVYYY